MVTKICPACGQTKSLDDFHKSKRERDGHSWNCKVCALATYRKRRLRNVSAAQASERKANLKHRHNTTPEEFQRLLDEQGGSCAVCSAPGTHIDHDHACCPGSRSCGQCIRGILCEPHNLMLGHAHDDPTVLRNAATYLEATRLRVVA